MCSMKFVLSFFFLAVVFSVGISQSITESIKTLESDKARLQNQMDILNSKIIDVQQKQIIEKLKAIGLPSKTYIEHQAMILEYSEAHEQAKWVAHIISPRIIDGLVYRSNDFRVDPKVSSGTAEQEDYFLTDTLSNGEVEYDGYGYDRGHLAPSADFRWSAEALSESYFYSNMSPQLPEFNQEKWAELENYLRRYVVVNGVPLFVVTLPILEDNLPKIKRSVNGVSIPKKYAKAIYDPVNKRSIGFIMENKSLKYPLESYATTIDKVEELSGLDLFSTLSEKIETELDKTEWFENLDGGDVEPIAAVSLPRSHFNTVQVKDKVGQEVGVCGTVVASRYSKKGHLWLNVDRHFPNQVFSIFIRKESLVNFEYNLKERFINQSVCVRGKVEDFSGAPTITLDDPHNIAFYKSIRKVSNPDSGR